MQPALSEKCKDSQTRVNLAGSDPLELVGISVETLRWAEKSEVAIQNLMLVIRLFRMNRRQTRGNCGDKLI